MILFIIGIICHLISVLLAFIPLFRFIFMKFIYKFNHYFFGFYKTKVTDLRKFKHDAKILLFQHNSFYDLFALGCYFGEHNITGILDADILEIPIINKIIESFDLIVVKKSEKNNSQKIIDYVNNPNKSKYLGIAPAGPYANIDDPIGSFKTGAFVPMKPVTPILIRYKNNKGTWFPFKNGPRDIIKWVYDILRFRKFYECELIILEEITAEGCSTPREYANKVEKYMKLNSQMLPPMT